MKLWFTRWPLTYSPSCSNAGASTSRDTNADVSVYILLDWRSHLNLAMESFPNAMVISYWLTVLHLCLCHQNATQPSTRNALTRSSADVLAPLPTVGIQWYVTWLLHIPKKYLIQYLGWCSSPSITRRLASHVMSHIRKCSCCRKRRHTTTSSRPKIRTSTKSQANSDTYFKNFTPDRTVTL